MDFSKPPENAHTDFTNHEIYKPSFDYWVKRSIEIGKKLVKDFDLIVAVMRSGVVPCHIMAKELEFYYGMLFIKPNDELVLINEYVDKPKKVVFVDDILSYGGTLNTLKKSKTLEQYDWRFCVLFYDNICSPILDPLVLPYYEKLYNKWLVLPWQTENIPVKTVAPYFRYTGKNKF